MFRLFICFWVVSQLNAGEYLFTSFRKNGETGVYLALSQPATLSEVVQGCER